MLTFFDFSLIFPLEGRVEWEVRAFRNGNGFYPVGFRSVYVHARDAYTCEIDEDPVARVPIFRVTGPAGGFVGESMTAAWMAAERAVRVMRLQPPEDQKPVKGPARFGVSVPEVSTLLWGLPDACRLRTGRPHAGAAPATSAAAPSAASAARRGKRRERTSLPPAGEHRCLLSLEDVLSEALPHARAASAGRPQHFQPQPQAQPQLFGALALARLVAVALTAYRSLQCGQVSTLRNAYYRNERLFPSAREASRWVSFLCELVRVPRHVLMFRASARGLVAGPLRYTDPASADIVDCMPGGGFAAPDSGGPGPTSLRYAGPLGQPIDTMAHLLARASVGTARFLLVVEKEAVYQSLVTRRFHLSEGNGVADGLILTGRGMPDVLSSSMTSHLSTLLPTLLLTDCDPAGILIAHHYKFGSAERLTYGYHPSLLNAPRARWVGILPTDLLTQVPEAMRCPLTRRDRELLPGLMAKATAAGWTEAVHEIAAMEAIGQKAEIQGLDEQSEAQSTRLETYLSAKIKAALGLPQH